MSKCILHFGMHKTGSTSIQESLWRNLDDPAFHYITFGEPNSNGKIATAFRNNPENDHYSKKRALTKKQVNQRKAVYLNKLNDELKAAGNRTMILSSELISRPGFQYDELARLCEFIVSRGHPIMAVGYIRSPKSFMESMFQQKVKGGGQKNFMLDGLYPEYRLRFEKFEQLIGRDNIHYWKFNPESFPNHCVVQDFCTRTGVSLRSAGIIKANDGLSLPALALLYSYRKLGPGYGSGPGAVADNHRLFNYLRKLPGPKLRFHSSLVEPIIDQHLDDIKWMEHRLGDSLEESLTKDDHQAISSEQEIFSHLPEATQWLVKQLGSEYKNRWNKEITPQQAAEWMHALRLKLAGHDLNTGQKTIQTNRIDLPTIVDRIKSKDARVLDGVSDKQAKSIVSEVLSIVSKHVDAMQEGLLRVNGLGSFRITNPPPGSLRAKKGLKPIIFRPTNR